MGKKTGKLNEKQRRFADEYLLSFNGTQSALKAGYSKKTAYSQANWLLKHPEVLNYLNSKKQKVDDKLNASLDRTLLELSRIAFSDLRKLFREDGSLIPIHELDADTAAAISGFDTEELYEFLNGEKNQIGLLKKVKRFDKNKAIEMLMKYHGAFEKDNKQQNKDITVTLNL